MRVLHRNPTVPLQLGVQFGVFDMAKHAVARSLRPLNGIRDVDETNAARHRREQSSLTGPQVWVTAALGGVAGATVCYPLASVMQQTVGMFVYLYVAFSWA